MNLHKFFTAAPGNATPTMPVYQWDITVDAYGQVMDARPEGSTLSVDAIEIRQWTKVWARARNEMGSLDLAWQWLTTPLQDISGQRPIDILHTFYGCTAVVDLLFVISFGFRE